MGALSPVAKQQFFDNNGDILAGGKLYTYVSGASTTPLATYTDAALSVANANPVILDARGECTLYLQDAQYRFVLKDSSDVTIWTRDNIVSPLFAGALGGTSPLIVDNIAALEALTGMSNDALATTLGYSTDNDGGHGTYRYDSGSSATVNGGTVINAAGGVGRWLLLDKRIHLKIFGAKGDAVGGVGTDDTAAIQAAIDYGNTNNVAIYADSGNYLCGQITTYPITTIIGAGRQVTNFWCKTGTTGKWWSDRGNGAQKTNITGCAFYGNSVTGLTHIAEWGNVGVQFGTEGILDDLWFRDAPNATGLDVDGNAGIIGRITLQSCASGIKTIGNANLLGDIIVVQCTGTQADLSGCHVFGLHLEATATGQLPLKMTGDVTIDALTLSQTNSATYSHLIEVDTASYNHWSIENIQTFGTYTVSNGNIKVGGTYYGGTATSATAGLNGRSFSYKESITSGVFELKWQQLQAFNVRITNTGGTMQHRIGSSGDSSLTCNFRNKVNNASQTLANTPTGADASTAFASGAKISSVATNTLILDTAAQIEADMMLMANISFNSTATDLTVWPSIVSRNVNGVTQKRLELEFFNATTGAAVALSSMGVGAILEVSVLCVLA